MSLSKSLNRASVNHGGAAEAWPERLEFFAQAEASGVQPRSSEEQVADIIEWTIATPGEAARGLAADLAATYQGKHQFLMKDLEHWDAETKAHRAHLIFRNEGLRALSAQTVMALRVRAAKA